MRMLAAAGAFALAAAACAAGGSAGPATAPSTTVGTTTGNTTGESTTTGPSTTEPGAATSTTLRVRPEGQAAPDFTLALGEGGEFSLSGEQKPVYMVFWAEW
ncbi:MAG: hypothetical protein Q8Q29_01455 [Actinomycetota bacterium]|jgi:hypothetical protein|nr:hypothetical protein [Actinomycetota bacterium]